MSEANARLLGASVLSVFLLGFGAYLLIDSSTSANLEKVATGWIGLVIGYWLR